MSELETTLPAHVDDASQWLNMMSLILINSLIWGMTNPLLKYYGSQSIKVAETQETANKNSFIIMKQLISLFGNFKFVGVQIINWCGSVFFLLVLGHTNLTT